jgi:hypothetical protein
LPHIVAHNKPVHVQVQVGALIEARRQPCAHHEIVILIGRWISQDPS